MTRKILDHTFNIFTVGALIIALAGMAKCTLSPSKPESPEIRKQAIELSIVWHQMEIERLKRELEK